MHYYIIIMCLYRWISGNTSCVIFSLPIVWEMLRTCWSSLSLPVSLCSFRKPPSFRFFHRCYSDVYDCVSVRMLFIRSLHLSRAHIWFWSYFVNICVWALCLVIVCPECFHNCLVCLVVAYATADHYERSCFGLSVVPQ